MDPNIGPAAPPDATPISAFAVEIYRHAFGHSFSPDDLRSHLDRSLSPLAFARILVTDVVRVAEVAELPGRLVGYVQFAATSTIIPIPSVMA